MMLLLVVVLFLALPARFCEVCCEVGEEEGVLLFEMMHMSEWY